jgi:diaminopimelate decarboxylase
MKPRLSDEQISNTFQRAITKGDVIGNDDTSVIFYDMSFLEERVRDLISLFPKTTLHAIAIKANPLTKILRHLNKFGVGVEAASLPELYIALNAGFSSDKIVFDSPVKTKKEIEYALNFGVHINADSFTELDRIDELTPK